MSLLNMVMKISGIREEKNRGMERTLSPDKSLKLKMTKNEDLESLDTYQIETLSLSRMYTATVKYPLSIFRLKKIVKKKDVVKDIFKNISECEDGYWDYEVGDNTSSNSMKYRLIIKHRKIKLVVNELRVIEFY